MNIDPGICPLCEVGRLVEHFHERHNETDGYKFVVRGLLHSGCTDCGEGVTTADQTRHNKRILIDARAQAGRVRLRAAPQAG